jgi:hypothetical protein
MVVGVVGRCVGFLVVIARRLGIVPCRLSRGLLRGVVRLSSSGNLDLGRVDFGGIGLGRDVVSAASVVSGASSASAIESGSSSSAAEPLSVAGSSRPLGARIR